ncbi:hypothetical protein BGAPBR_I0037 (plasmid) [Borreliella garinii PBr]|uniref:Uncharacterized protein n=1 Tax=Borreliella garinii PBr TaxID=498743 RepID=B8F116_BORGR|nr:hypothetical protein BGAPBR_I0037 [Borreliella garinii PBr]
MSQLLQSLLNGQYLSTLCKKNSYRSDLHDNYLINLYHPKLLIVFQTFLYYTSLIDSSLLLNLD